MLSLRIFPWMPEPMPRRSAECVCLVLPQPASAFPIIRLGRLPACLREYDFPRGGFRGCSYFVMFRPPSLLASQIVPTAASFLAGQPRLFTSKQNVCRYLHTHRTCYPPDYRQLVERGLSPRKIRSLIGCSRMMPPFPSPSLKFRKAGFPRSGFKASISDRAFPSTASLAQRSVCLRPSYSPLPPLNSPYCAGETWRAGAPPFEQLALLYPRGPRSEPSYSVSVHHHLLAPSAPLAGTSRFHRIAAYTGCPRCAFPPRRPASGSVLSLLTPSRHAALRDLGESIGCASSVLPRWLWP